MIADINVGKKSTRGDVLIHNGKEYTPTSLEMLLKPYKDRIKALELRDEIHSKQFDNATKKIEHLEQKIHRLISAMK